MFLFFFTTVLFGNFWIWKHIFKKESCMVWSTELDAVLHKEVCKLHFSCNDWIILLLRKGWKLPWTWSCFSFSFFIADLLWCQCMSSYVSCSPIWNFQVTATKFTKSKCFTFVGCCYAWKLFFIVIWELLISPVFVHYPRMILNQCIKKKMDDLLKHNLMHANKKGRGGAGHLYIPWFHL